MKPTFATNRIATNTSATNAGASESSDGDGAKGVLAGRGDRAGDLPPNASEAARERGLGKTRNRRTRESYNNYQREYMKTWRAKKKSASPV